MQTTHSAQCAAARRTDISFPGPGPLQHSLLRRLAFLLTAVGSLFLAGNARAFETVHGPGNDEWQPSAPAQNMTTSSAPAAAEDACLPLLKALPIDMNASAMDRNRRSAGETAGIGLVFGIRFALDSGNRRRAPRLGIWQPSVTGDPHALALADYNRCKGDQALKALGDDWRWSR